ncbi:MAG: tRNA 2-thiouridine(34) synthase MnmA [Akkermansia sp.]|nr:tRNA 2-thiouridine(34) synthase MnmA [Akkermansia sp.]
MARILVALSGGVDSAAAAALLVEQGHEVVAAYMKNWVNEENIPGECPWERDIEDALGVCRTLGIELRVVDLIAQYRERVVNYLIEGYRSGSTPNPDVLCNREMKFGVLLDYALEQGFTGVATGHYANRLDIPGEGSYILRGADRNKDQSYFLALMRPEQVAHAIFPVGHITKPQVRDIARRFHLPNAEKKDSQGICFIGQVKMSDFLRHYLPDNPGEIVDLNGRVLGQHQGLHLFTMGQRKGHHIASPKEGVAYVVVGKDLQKNRLILGYEGEETPGLYTRSAIVGSITNTLLPLPERVMAQPRYRAPAVHATCTHLDDNKVLLDFDEPVRAVALGQVCALYAPDADRGERLLGGGFFESIRV